jgi:phage N-6-adenine-methyltransferase
VSQQDYRTPGDVLGPLHKEFEFNVDAAADKNNALLGRYYTEEVDGANPEHYEAGDRVFCNPPYTGQIVKRFVECAAITSRRGALWVLLLNASTTGTSWFHKFIWDANLHRPREGVEVRFRKGRISFLNADGIPQTSPRYDNMVVVFHPREG